MKSKKIKLISLVLAVVLTLSCAIIAATAVNAATGSAGEVVYFDNSVTKWSSVNCYAWADGSGDNGGWPGKPMTNVEGDIWAYTLVGSTEKVIFNTDGVQSDDIIFEGSNKIAKPNGTGAKFTVTWADYTGTATVPTQATTAPIPTTPTTPTTPGASAGTVYCQNDAGWSTVYCYMWNDSPKEENKSWPGVPMTSLGDGVYEYNPPKAYKNVIFNNNSSKTGDLTANYGQIFNNKSSTWEPYNAGPVKITGLSTDIQSPAYTTCSISINATAKSSVAGALNYKFTVSAGSMQTVLSNSTASSVAWVPTSAGKYTITVEVKDAEGNTADRSIEYTINDATILETAFIKAFSNSLNTTKQLKLNAAVSFTMSALGGHTGNGLLFYKFQITDPDGNNNIAYYTTKNVYSFTPTKLGVYQVKAYVQNSYNATVNQTYNYNCVTEINETPDTTLPPVTTPTVPSTAPTTAPPTQATTAPTTAPPTQATTAPTTAPPTQATTAPTTAPTKPAERQLGDVNGDGSININDVTAIQKHLADIKVLTDADKAYADTDRDGNVTIKDATMIQKFICGMVTVF